MKLIWAIIAVACILAAATFLWWGRTDIAFVAAALGVIAWFLQYRAHYKRLVADADKNRNASQEEIDED